MNKFNNLFLVKCCILITLFSCNDTDTNDDLVKHEDEFHEEVANTELNKVNVNTIEISSPLEASQALASSGIAYNKRLMHSLTKVASYSTAFRQGINLGIYITDATYATVYDQTQDAMSYLAITKRLASNLGIEDAIDKAMIKKYEANVGNKDTLVRLMDRTYRNADAYLRVNHRQNIASLVLAGALIESLHLSSQLYSDTMKLENKASFMKKLSEQEKSVGKLIDMLSQYKEENAYTQLLISFEELKEIYNSIDKKSPKLIVIKEKVQEIRALVI